jgi:hydrogenase maturation factor
VTSVHVHTSDNEEIEEYSLVCFKANNVTASSCGADTLFDHIHEAHPIVASKEAGFVGDAGSLAVCVTTNDVEATHAEDRVTG